MAQVRIAHAMYSKKAAAVPQKLVITFIELLLIGVSAWIMFGTGQMYAARLFGFEPIVGAAPMRRWLILAFSGVVLVRMSVMMFRFMRRDIPWLESVTVPLAFALYYVGFALFVLPSTAPLGFMDLAATALYGFGSYLNTAGELGRDRFKRKKENKGKLYTGGPFAWSMHINFFGDILWVAAYAIVTRNVWAALVPIGIGLFFACVNVPALDTYLAGRYGEDFQEYRRTTKRLIPFVW